MTVPPDPQPDLPAPLSDPTDPTDLSWYAVPDTVKQWLTLASEHWQTPEIGDIYMDQALASAQDHPDVLVSAYRYFFYTGNYTRALQVTTTVLDQVQAAESLPTEWLQLKPILTQRRDETSIRLYINAYAASGLIRAKLGEVELAQQIAGQVSEIEHRNEFGGKVVHEILTAPEEEDED